MYESECLTLDSLKVFSHLGYLNIGPGLTDNFMEHLTLGSISHTQFSCCGYKRMGTAEQFN